MKPFGKVQPQQKEGDEFGIITFYGVKKRTLLNTYTQRSDVFIDVPLSLGDRKRQLKGRSKGESKYSRQERVL